jgi:hypothetical protein
MSRLSIKQLFGNVNKKIPYLVYYIQTVYIMLCSKHNLRFARNFYEFVLHQI